MPRTILFLLHVVFPLALGSWIYIAWRTPTLFVFDWLYALHIDPTPFRLNFPLPHFIMYCLPDGCWVYAGTSWMLLIWQRLHPWTGVYLVLALGGEFGQLFGVVPGTYETLDVLASLIGFLLPVLVLAKCAKNICGHALHCS